MKIIRTTLAASIAISTLVSLSACGGQSPSGNAQGGATGSDKKAALVIAQGGLGDEAYNDLAYKGFKAAAAKDNVDGKPIESKDIVAQGEQVVRTAAQSGYGLVADLEYSHADMLGKVAKDFPDTHFAIVNAVVKGDNVTSVMFKEQEGSYLAGVLAALQTQNTGDKKINSANRIGFIGGTKSTGIDKFLAGYIQGAKSVDPSIKVDARYTNSFGDASKGQQIADQMYDDGSDIIYASAGGSGAGVIESAKKNNHYAIGVDSNQDAVEKGYVLTSMMKRTDVAMQDLVGDFADDKVPGGKTLNYGLKDNGVGLTDMKYTKSNIKKSTLDKVEAAKKSIIDGKTKVWDVTEQGYPSWMK